MPGSVLRRPVVVLGAVLAVVALVFLILSGVALGTSVALVIVIGVQAMAGGYAWRLARRQPCSAPEIVGAGLALGTVASVVSGLVVFLIFGVNFGWALPAVVAIVVWIVRRSRAGASTNALPWDRPTVWASVAAVVLGCASLIPNLRNYPLSWTGTWTGYHGDMLFFESISTSLARLGPLDSIFTPDALLRYHWLVYAWGGQISDAVGAQPFVVLTRVIPLMSVVGGCLLAVSWARSLTKVAWVPVLAVVLLLTGGYVGASYGAVFNFDSPSQAMSVLWLLAFCLAVLAFVREGHWSLVVISSVLAAGLAGGKISSAAVAVAAVVWLAAVGVVRRTAWRNRALGAALATLIGAGLGYLLVVSGSDDPGGLNILSLLDRASSIQGMNPIPGRGGIVLGTALLIVAIVARWAGVLWLLTKPSERMKPDLVLAVGFMIAGVATVVLLSGGMNDTWFALAASVPLAVISAAGVGEAWLTLGERRRAFLVLACLAAVAVTAVVLWLWSTGPSGGNVFTPTLRWAGPIVGVVLALVVALVLNHWLLRGNRGTAVAAFVVLVVLVAALARFMALQPRQTGEAAPMAEYAFSPVSAYTPARDTTRIPGWSDSQVEAARYLSSRSSIDDRVATNVSFSALVPALTGRQTLASGISYQAPYGRPGTTPILLDRERQSWEFIDTPTSETLRPLCESGVSWLWVDPTRTAMKSWSPFGDVRFSADDVVLVSIACG